MRRLLATAATATAATASYQFVPAPGGGYGVLASGGWRTLQPLWAETVYANGSTILTVGAWTYANSTTGAASGSLQTPGGAVLSFSDSLADAADDGSGAGFRLRRTVTVLATDDGDERAFSTRFALAAPGGLAGAQRSLFMPGVAYSNASALPPGALAGDPLAAHILVREDRLPLPCAMAHFAGAGAARLVHVAPDGGTLPDEDFTARIVDARLQFGSIGFLNGAPASFSLAFQFPGSEGDRTYVWRPADGWANRSHPLQPGVPHAYTLDFRWDGNTSSSYGAAVTRAWRAEFAAAAPRLPAPTPAPQQLYRDGMELLAAVSVSYGGVPSVPFEAALPTGAVIDTSSQMGFVGRALPAAALLLYDAVVAAPNATRRAQAEALVDLWAAEAPTACGSVRTWYNLGGAGGRITWRPADAYQGSLRIQCDGMAGMLAAWNVVPNPAWLAAATRFADFLVRVQAPDGSIGAAYDWACAPLAGDTRQTPQVVPFLAAAWAATRDERYAAAAQAAGAYAAAMFAGGFSYVGGAPDNPDVPDREAGWLAAQAFLALFDLTGNSTWLAPAAQAASYAETFVYAWDVPLPCNQTPPTVYPCRRSTLGASLIATGQSGADNYMSIAHHDYKRLAQLTGDAHFADFGALLAATTSQVVDWDGSLGYAARGLMNEATTLSVRRGAGVADWLPWLSVNLLQPIVQEMEAHRERSTPHGTKPRHSGS